MKSPTLNFLSGVLFAISSLIALGYFGSGIGSQTTVKEISNVVSPDGKFLATTTRASNNNWCEERTNIHKKDDSFGWETEYIFDIDCGSDVELKWKDNRNVEIVYSYNSESIVRTTQEFMSKDKDVKISYVLKQ